MNDLLNALTLLTIFQFPSRGTTISARALTYYPLVGILLGVMLSGAGLLLRLLFPSLVVAALVIGPSGSRDTGRNGRCSGGRWRNRER